MKRDLPKRPIQKRPSYMKRDLHKRPIQKRRPVSLGA